MTERLRDTGRHRLREYVESFDARLADGERDRYCAAHSGMVQGQYDLQRRVADAEEKQRDQESRLRVVEQAAAAARPWLTLLASAGSAALAAVLGRLL